MECSEIIGHLSEYIDGVLDSDRTAKVENHLKSCADCRNELEALKRVIQTLGSMDGVETPEGFMKGVHQRIERRSWWSGISRSLFVPFRLKIPIQVASLATACLLVLLIYHNMRTEEEVATLMQESGRRVAVEKAMEAAPEPAKPGKATKPRPALMKVKSIQEKKAEKPLALVLRVSKGSEYPSYRKRKPAPPAEKRLVQPAGKRKEAYLDQMASTKAPKEIVAEKSMSREADLAEKPTSMSGVAAEEQAAAGTGILLPGGYDKLSARMKRWTREAGGRILHTGYEEATGRPVRFSVEIPGRQLADFLKKLSNAGSLETHAPIASREVEKRVRLDIRLSYDR